jgi:hypothetical protein
MRSGNGQWISPASHPAGNVQVTAGALPDAPGLRQ